MKRPPAPLPKLPEQCELIDTHCHLDMEVYASDLDTVICSAVQAGVKKIITIGINSTSSFSALSIANQHNNVFATVGFHPHEALHVTIDSLEELAKLACNNSVVGWGEIGLDFAKNYASRDVQLRTFRDQLQIAKTLNLPVVIHDREAHEDTLAQIRLAGTLPKGGVMHCFSGNVNLARELIDLGFYISIPGVATFATAQSLHEVIQAIDIQHLLLETDGPFLTPVPFRGKRNEPKFLLYTAQVVANLKQISIEEVASVTTANAIRLFNLPNPTIYAQH